MRITRRQLSRIIRESLEKSADVVSQIYDRIWSNPRLASACQWAGQMECHESTGWVMDNLQDEPWYDDLTFYMWPEEGHEDMIQKLKDNPIEFGDPLLDDSLRDIISGSMFGHSFLAHRGKFVDPMLKSMGASDSQIQTFDSYLAGTMDS